MTSSTFVKKLNLQQLGVAICEGKGELTRMLIDVIDEKADLAKVLLIDDDIDENADIEKCDKTIALTLTCSELQNVVEGMLAAELEKKDGDERGRGMSPLIHGLISDFSESVLPFILRILVKHQYNLESRDILHRTPLSIAAMYGRKDTVNFLIEHKAEINDPINPALCDAIELLINDSRKLDMAKNLVKHGAAINIQD